MHYTPGWTNAFQFAQFDAPFKRRRSVKTDVVAKMKKRERRRKRKGYR